MDSWRRRLLGFWLVLGGVLVLTTPGGAGILDASWTAPTTNVDGSPLTDLAGYRLYYGLSNPPCPGTAFLSVAATTSSPGPTETVTSRLTGLSAGALYYVSVTAVNTSGNESACVTPASAVARSNFAVSPAGPVDFGSVSVGGVADRTFSIQNTGGGTVSGTAVVSAPFSVVSGNPFNLVGAGATQAVTVRFSPTVVATANANVNFTAGGDTISSAVTGIGSTSTDTTLPTVAITVPTPNATVSGTTTVTATATDNVGVVGVQFKLNGANLGAEVTAAPYTIAWNTTTAANGPHTLTAVARDAAGNVATSAGISVTAVNDVTAPVISAVTVSSLTSSGATISWTTDEASDTQVEYGPTTAYGRVTPLSTSRVTTHVQQLNGLAASTVYHFRVKSRDVAGNLATSEDFTLATLTDPGFGLMAYWSFDQSGATVPDSSGNGHTGTLANGPTSTSGRIGPALSFDGIDDYVSVAHAASLNAYPLTIAVWTKTSESAGVRGIVSKYDALFNGFEVFMDSGRLCAWYFRDSSNYVYDGTGCTLATPGYSNNQWHHVVFVVDTAGGRLYVDGVQRASRAWTGTPGAVSTTRNLAIGRDAVTANPSYSGVLDEVRFYNRALNASEVSQLYTGTGAVTDATPPMLSAIMVYPRFTSSAVISWRTTEASDTQVEYGRTTGYGSATPLNRSMVTFHSQALGGLAPGTLYHFRIKSRDAVGNLTVSGDLTFTTAVEVKKKKSRSLLDKIAKALRRLF